MESADSGYVLLVCLAVSGAIRRVVSVASLLAEPDVVRQVIYRISVSEAGMGDPWRKYPLLTSGQAYKMDHFLMKNPWALPVAAVVIAVILIVGAYFIGRGCQVLGIEPFSMDEGPPRLSDSSSGAKEVIKTVEVR